MYIQLIFGKGIRIVLISVALTITALIVWPVGILLGNFLTQSSPPPMDQTPDTASAFLVVCIIDAILLSLLIWNTRSHTGTKYWVLLALYVWMLQFFLPQMETYFFVEQITPPQILSILIAGVVMCLTTVRAGVWIAARLTRQEVRQPVNWRGIPWKAVPVQVAILILIVYPLLYFTFGFFVAWQSDAVREFYTGSTEMSTFFAGTWKAITDGVYFYQVLRAALWVAISVPVILLLKERPVAQYFLLAAIPALLPTILLFLPNPYMPQEVRMAHFVETSLSNFLWGLAMVVLLRTKLDRSTVTVQDPPEFPSRPERGQGRVL